jgi:asparagine synthase (glutamine-hydrolysing)
LISERPLGSFLSGGYDSTIVTAYMAKLMSEKVQTYSIGFNSAQFNEAHHAKQVANYLGTNHHEEILSPDPALVVEKISHVLTNLLQIPRLCQRIYWPNSRVKT